MASFTITEKGYALRRPDGPAACPWSPRTSRSGPEAPAPRHERGRRRDARRALPGGSRGPWPCAQHGQLQPQRRKAPPERGGTRPRRGADSAAWCPRNSVHWLSDEDETRVSFPWSMIDKITPPPSDQRVRKRAGPRMGLEDMAPIVTARGTYIAAFVNAEVAAVPGGGGPLPQWPPAPGEGGRLPHRPGHGQPYRAHEGHHLPQSPAHGA